MLEDGKALRRGLYRLNRWAKASGTRFSKASVGSHPLITTSSCNFLGWGRVAEKLLSEKGLWMLFDS